MYLNIYIYLPGEKIEVKENGEKFNNIAVPLDPQDKLSKFQVYKTKTWQIVSYWLVKFSLPLNLIGIIITGLAAYSNSEKFYQFIFILTLILFVFDVKRKFIERKFSLVKLQSI